nr:uncharacterized protein LOC131786730 [Pocillopora verrucosa]
MASTKDGEIQQANQEQVLAENQSAECKVKAPEQSTVEEGKKKRASQLALAQEEVATLKLTKDATLQAQFKKERENLLAMSTMFKYVQNETSKVKQSLQEERKSRDRKEAELKCEISSLSNKGTGLQSRVTNLMNKISEHKKEIEKLRTAKGKLRDNVYKQEITINKMEKKLGKMENRSENFKMRLRKSEKRKDENIMKGLEYRKILSQKKKELKTIQEQHKAEKQSLLAQIESCKAECRRRRRIIEADKEMKVVMGGTIEFLRQKNAFLLRELTSGFVGKYRTARQLFGAVFGAIRARFH